jgi:hypothetical protein
MQKRVNIHHVEEKLKSKKELYQFLLQDCSAFLPNMDSTNVYFLKQIMSGEKEVCYVTFHHFIPSVFEQK